MAQPVRDRQVARKASGRMAQAQQGQLQTLSLGRKNWILFGAGLAALVLGFGLLALGDITLAPILLLAGYLVLIPWALVARPRPPAAQGKEKVSGEEGNAL